MACPFTRAESDMNPGRTSHYAPEYFQTFIPGLNLRPKCYLTVVGWVATGIPEPEDMANRNYRSAEGEVAILALCFRWLTLPRTLAEMQSVVGTRCCCIDLAGSSEDKFHAMGLGWFEKNTDHRTPAAYLISLCTLPFISIPHNFAKFCTRPDVLEKRLRWPQRIDHIFPHGPETTTRSLLAWTSVEGVDPSFSSHLARSLYSWTQATLRLTLPWTVTSASFAEGLCRMAITAVDAFGDSKRQSTIEEFERDVVCLRYTVQMLNAVAIHPLEKYGQTFLSYCPEDFLDFCDRVGSLFERFMLVECPASGGRLSSILTSQECSDLCNILDRVGGMLYDMFPKIKPKDNETPLRHQRFVDNTSARRWSHLPTISEQVLLRIELHLACRHKSHFCDNPCCSRTQVDTGRRMKVCAHCHQVQYCSRSCQRQAWKSIIPETSHRELCNQFCRLQTEFNLPTRITSLRNTKTSSLANFPTSEERQSEFREICTRCRLYRA